MYAMSSENDDYYKEQCVVKKRVSIVWKYFEKLNRFRVRCKLCRHEQNYQGTTGNILRHLKNKHSIDATIKGQSEHPDSTRSSDSANSRKIGENEKERDDDFDVMVKTERNDNIPTIPRQTQVSSIEDISCNNEKELDPYAERNTGQFSDYMESPLIGSFKRKSPQPLNSDVGYQNGDSTCRQEKQKTTIMEERLIAEIEYFREKAAYYRMQKNLTSLQAKKVRYELDQMS